MHQRRQLPTITGPAPGAHHCVWVPALQRSDTVLSDIAIMFDYETWAKTANAAVRSLGAVAFHMFDASVEFEAFYVNIKDAPSDQPGRVFDPETQAWWNEQGDEAKAVFDNPRDPKVSLLEAHVAFDAFCVRSGASLIWCNGLPFDLPIYENITASLWRKPWYDFRAASDTRTLWRVAGAKNYARPNWPIKHHALHDSCNQAMTVIEAHDKLGVKTYG